MAKSSCQKVKFKFKFLKAKLISLWPIDHWGVNKFINCFKYFGERKK